jgi:hypothetical protein
LKKARQVEYQKLQRKFRKERKDVEKLAAVVKELERKLANRNSHSDTTVQSESLRLALAGPPAEIASSTRSLVTSFVGNETADEARPDSVMDQSGDEGMITNCIFSTNERTKVPEKRSDESHLANDNKFPFPVPSECNNLAPPESDEGKQSKRLRW